MKSLVTTKLRGCSISLSMRSLICRKATGLTSSESAPQLVTLASNAPVGWNAVMMIPMNGLTPIWLCRIDWTSLKVSLSVLVASAISRSGLPA